MSDDRPTRSGNAADSANTSTDAARSLPGPMELPWYLASSGLWLAATTLQMFLVQWLLVFHLGVDPMALGFSRALIEAPPLLMLLVAGLIADRVDGRRVLIALAAASCLPPLLVVALLDSLGYWLVVGFGIAMALMQSASEPSRAAMLNRTTRLDIQRTVTLMTVVTTLVSLVVIWLGGRLEGAGIGYVLAMQAGVCALAGLTASRLSPQPPTPGSSFDLRAGLRALWNSRPIRNVIGVNFVSSMFNAGAYLVVIPLIVREIYAGDAAFLANLFIAFTLGTAASNLGLLALMPLARPGRVFIIMQLTRLAILVGVWAQPPSWLFLVLIFGWGMNMGVTTTLVRSIVQELAPAEHRAKMLSVLLVSFMVAAPVYALILGAMVAVSGALAGLVPGMIASVAIFVLGRFSPSIWAVTSGPSPPRQMG